MLNVNIIMYVNIVCKYYLMKIEQQVKNTRYFQGETLIEASRYETISH